MQKIVYGKGVGRPRQRQGLVDQILVQSPYTSAINMLPGLLLNKVLQLPTGSLKWL